MVVFTQLPLVIEHTTTTVLLVAILYDMAATRLAIDGGEQLKHDNRPLTAPEPLDVTKHLCYSLTISGV